MSTVRTFCLYDGIDGVDNSVAGDDIEGGDVGTSGGALNLKNNAGKVNKWFNTISLLITLMLN